MTVSAFDHPLLGGLFAEPQVASFFDAPAQVAHALAFEAALTRALVATGRISDVAAFEGLAAIENFDADYDALREGVARNGVLAPVLVATLRGGLSAPEAIHTGATSQDISDTALALTLKSVSEVLAARLAAVTSTLADLDEKFGANRLMAHTRMQPALGMPAGHRLSAWKTPLDDLLENLGSVTRRAAALQLGGPVGDRREWQDDAPAIAAHMAAELGLRDPGRAWHSDRQAIVAYGDWLSHLSGALGKIGTDIALMAQTGPDALILSSGGASSAMPHKSNPVGAELLVALARFNAAQVAGLHGALVHEQERSGAAWMVEWMILPQMAAATARGLTIASETLGQVDRIGVPA